MHPDEKCNNLITIIYNSKTLRLQDNLIRQLTKATGESDLWRRKVKVASTLKCSRRKTHKPLTCRFFR